MSIQNLVGGPISEVVDLISCDNSATFDNIFTDELAIQERITVNKRLQICLALIASLSLFVIPLVQFVSFVPIVGGVLRLTESGPYASVSLAVVLGLFI